ncbi:hypothetical protein GCM10023149_24460 [Mucilaginibacter gynuensis]|uniref:Sigma-54 factor interaction domain-containing protein n=1 Tax=Mucilaginibacter gynuensis TaxID=1302236 RepID=A0ABP8GFT6_9SPHI
MAKLDSNAKTYTQTITADEMPFEAIEKQILSYEQEKSILLTLSDDITRVREKSDLITLFASRMKGFFYFKHTIVMLIDQAKGTYAPFLLDPVNSPIINHPGYPDLVKTTFSINAPVINEVIAADSPITFLLKEILHIPGLPSFININYECGIREMMITPLKSKMETIGFILVYSDRTDSFTNEFKAILKGIAPQLSSAVSNIITNDEINKNELTSEVLLSVSNEMVSVKNRSDLLNTINTGLKKLIDFTHNEMTVLDEGGDTYHVLLASPEINETSDYSEAISIPYSANDGIYSSVTNTDDTYLFDLRSLDLADAPLWLKLNYAAGAREMLIKVLPYNDVPKHKLILFAEKQNVFNDRALGIINSIASQLGTAVNNIAANEEILNKEKDTSFLLELSSSIAAVRTKTDLELVIYHALKKLSNIQVYVIRKMTDDGLGLSAYMFDQDMVLVDDPIYQELLHNNTDPKKGLTGRVMAGNQPVIIDVEKEYANGNRDIYIQLWRNNGIKKAYGVPLKVGNKALGLLWIVTDEINIVLVKSIGAQVSTAMSNIIANEKILALRKQLEIENSHLNEQINTIYNFSDIVGQGPEMQKVYGLMKRVAESNSTVLILGETGTGKELIARAIHHSSPRKSKIMIKVNCAALPANLIESELFGHEKGAFTGATDRRIGKFELANNSTIFLDEIGELPLELQVKLLRVIQEREFERVGGTTTIKVDVRIVAATNRNLENEVDEGKFRSDLFYRLNVFPIHLPSLRERQEDIIPLANYFLSRYGKLTGIRVNSFASKIITELQTYQWPGNVRELEHLVERSVLLSSDSVIREIDLPKPPTTKADEEIVMNRTLDDLERDYIVEVLKRCSGKIAGTGGAAQLLNIPSTTLHSKMKKLNITRGDYFGDDET